MSKTLVNSAFKRDYEPCIEHLNPTLTHMNSESRPRHTRFNSQSNANDPYLTKCLSPSIK